MWRTYSVILIIALAAPGLSLARESLTIGYLPILDHLPLIVSDARDKDTLQHVDLRLRKFKSWNSMVGALKAGQLDGVFILSPLAINLYQSGTDVQAILLAHRNGSAIIGRKGEQLRKANDLAGKVVAIPHKKATHTALLDSYLRSAGLSLADVKTPVISPSNMVQAMGLGKIDAFIVAEPFGAKAQHDGVGERIVLTKDLFDRHVECIVVVNRLAIRQKYAAIQEWVNSLLRAARFIEQDRADNGAKAVAAITKQYMGHPEAVTRTALLDPLDRIVFTDLEPRPDEFQEIVDIAVQAGLIKPLNLSMFIDSEFFDSSPEK